MKLLPALAAALLLQACAYPLTLQSRDGGPGGTGTANSGGKTVEIALNGKTYRGSYIYDGGAVIPTQTFGSATASNRYGTTTAFGSSTSTTYVPGSGAGRILAMAGPGDSIRCEFMYRGSGGMGVCEDNSGKAYDLLIAGPGQR
jgi:hypothetical protein